MFFVCIISVIMLQLVVLQLLFFPSRVTASVLSSELLGSNTSMTNAAVSSSLVFAIQWWHLPTIAFLSLRTRMCGLTCCMTSVCWHVRLCWHMTTWLKVGHSLYMMNSSFLYLNYVYRCDIKLFLIGVVFSDSVLCFFFSLPLSLMLRHIHICTLNQIYLFACFLHASTCTHPIYFVSLF